MARWVLVRHGETDWNKAGRLQGHTNTTLSVAGRVQVKALRERLRGMKFEAVYTSDLMRTVETTTLLLEGSGLTPEPTALLREMNYGEWEGLTWAEVQERDPEAYEEWLRVDPNFEAPGGESLNALMDRAENFASRARQAGGDGNTLIVTHGGIIRMLVLHLLGLDASHYRRLANPASASVTVVDLYGETAVLEIYADAAHYRPLT